MHRARMIALATALAILSLSTAPAENATAEGLTTEALAGVRLRELGPALKPGRVADIAVDPKNRSTWYLAMASSGLWKTTNAGTTWTPIFDDYGSYSLGCVTVDPRDSDVVWLGTGENQASRSASFGDGVYMSTDGGQTWRRVGLPDSEHVAKILIDPRDSDTVLVASQGPLWSAGGDRGLFKTTDGGETWTPILEISKDTGVTDVVADPRDFDRLYAASYQRRRNVGLLVGGGPEAGVFKSEDGGETWKELTVGLPSVDLGRIALGISPHNPDVVYALVVAAGEESGFFRSADRGETWTRQSNYRVVDPQYYGEIYPDPHHVERIYAVDVRVHRTDDGGKTFEAMPWRIHVDHHALAFDPTDPDHLLVGNDGGLYETHDGGRTWRHFTNLPTAQFYHLAVDNAEPFYHVYGGTQDNGSQGGPSRTVNRAGIRTSDWLSVGGADGMQPRVDPRDPSVVYAMSQYGSISRLDLDTGATQSIRPRLGRDGPEVRWNWGSPFIISPHDPERLYLAGSRLFRSDNRGDQWRLVSPDLTRQIDRDTLPVMGKVWGDDAVTKNLFTTDYGVCSALSESPVYEGLLVLGTNDGLLQVTNNGGESWRRIDGVAGVPDRTPVSDVVASSHDADRIYASFENHENGDYAPYLFKSVDGGESWSSITGDLPERGFVWSVVEDPENPRLLFAGTEFGLFVTVNGGENWAQIKGGAPTIAFRDLEIQRREVDLACATFGRGFFVLDDYTPLRCLSEEALARDAALLPSRPARRYTEKGFVQATAGDYRVPNPPVGAMITYYLAHDLPEGHAVSITIAGRDGEAVRTLSGPATAGVHRVHWDLRREAQRDEGGERRRRRRGRRAGPLVDIGTYSVMLNRVVDDESHPLDEPQRLEVTPLRRATN